jgi:dihydrofolate reductase
VDHFSSVTSEQEKRKKINMRKIIVSVYTTLDGYMEPLDWHFPFLNEDTGRYSRDLLFSSDALLMGRETYEAFAASWPTMTKDSPGAEGLAERINNMPKFVASTTLKEPLEWNATLLKGNIVEAVSRLKQQPGKNILMYGAGRLAHTLMQHGLVDELRVWVHPVIWGSGKQLFKNATDIPYLQLVDTKPFNTGIVILTYQPTEGR